MEQLDPLIKIQSRAPLEEIGAKQEVKETSPWAFARKLEAPGESFESKKGVEGGLPPASVVVLDLSCCKWQ